MITTKVKDWKPLEDGSYETQEGIVLHAKHLNDICEFHKIPATLLAIDKKFHTHTFHDVCRTATEEVELIQSEDGKQVQVLDPKSNFVTDDEFLSIANLVQETTHLDLQEHSNGFSKILEVKAPALDSDNFIGDVYNKSMRIERLPQGGINLSTALLRIICTNMCTVKDKQFSTLIRSGKLSDAIIQAFANSVSNFSVEEYLKNLFYHNGEPVIASVADYLGMRDTLQRITDLDKEGVDAFYPVQPIQEFYESQNIDINTLNRSLLNRLPSGIEYYNCFNILTNGAKMAERNLKNEIAVADWARKSRMQSVQASDLVFQGMPWFSANEIKHRMGDI